MDSKWISRKEARRLVSDGQIKKVLVSIEPTLTAMIEKPCAQMPKRAALAMLDSWDRLGPVQYLVRVAGDTVWLLATTDVDEELT